MRNGLIDEVKPVFQHGIFSGIRLLHVREGVPKSASLLFGNVGNGHQPVLLQTMLGTEHQPVVIDVIAAELYLTFPSLLEHFAGFVKVCGILDLDLGEGLCFFREEVFLLES